MHINVVFCDFSDSSSIDIDQKKTTFNNLEDVLIKFYSIIYNINTFSYIILKTRIE